MNIKSSNVRQENPPFHNPNNIIFEIPQAIDTILLMNKYVYLSFSLSLNFT